jgi:hypothetical protein
MLQTKKIVHGFYLEIISLRLLFTFYTAILFYRLLP